MTLHPNRSRTGGDRRRHLVVMALSPAPTFPPPCRSQTGRAPHLCTGRRTSLRCDVPRVGVGGQRPSAPAFRAGAA